jgi:succinate dehydrogenase hydrophobic anchor subunit
MVAPGKSRGLKRLGFSSWLVTLFALATEVFTLNNASAGVWSPEWMVTLLVFFGISGSMLALSENRFGVSLLMSLASCAPVLYALLYEFGIAGAAMLVIVYAVRIDHSDEKSPEVIRTRQIAIKLNRFTSWVFIGVSVVNLVTGYVITRFNLSIVELTLIHDYFSYVFAGLLALHVVLSLISGYPWAMIIRNVMDRRTGYFIALLLQEATAILLLFLSTFQFLTGLGWVRDDVAAVLPMILHIDADGLLLIALIIHGMVGIRFVLMRRRRKMLGGDVALVAITVSLIAAVLLFNA